MIHKQDWKWYTSGYIWVAIFLFIGLPLGKLMGVFPKISWFAATFLWYPVILLGIYCVIDEILIYRKNRTINPKIQG